jgi:3-oxoacyl-[acyl-carrier-protein] synthase-3
MNIDIRNIGLSQPDNSIGYIEHAKRAGQTCLENIGVGIDEIDLLINVGNYRDNNMCEPSIAVLIQHALGINLNPLTQPVKAHTFSFDLLNGTCGLLNALQVANAMLSSKNGRYALLVSGDTHPSMQSNDAFPYAHNAVAILVEHTQQRHFLDCTFATTEDFHGTLGYLDLDTHGLKSRTSITLESNLVGEQSLDFAQNVLSKYITQHDIVPSDTVLLAIHPDSTVIEKLTGHFGFQHTVPAAITQDFHTAALGVGLAHALQNHPNKNILCVAIGTGLTVGCTLYRQVQ